MQKILDSKGRKFLQTREGFSATPYLDSKGVATIGFGNTFYANGKRVTMSDKPITRAYAEELFNIVVAQFEKDVNYLLKKEVTQNQFNSLVSFAYNVGSDIDADTIAEGLGDSTLLKKVNKNPNDQTIKAEFAKWIYSGGRIVDGLISRRKLEAELYFTN